MATSPERTPLTQLLAAYATASRTLYARNITDAKLAVVLLSLVEVLCDDVTWKDALDQRYKNQEFCLAAIKAGTKLAEECRKSISSEDWQPVINLLEEEKLKARQRPTIIPQDGAGLTSSRFAWDIDFVGMAHMQLFSEMRDSEKTYAPYGMIIPIVQSSGTGKSRTVDELAKIIFTIPICLRQPDETGYPYGDAPLCAFFGKKINCDNPQLSCIDLLRSIIRECSKILQPELYNANNLARGWYDRLKPVDGATNPIRNKLYTDACDNLTNSQDLLSARNELVKEFRTLANVLPKDVSLNRLRAIIYIDESHYLSRIDAIFPDGKKRNLLDAMLHAIDICGTDGLFGITLSTNSSFRKVTPRSDEFISERELSAQPTKNARPVPFTLLPFDNWNGSTIIHESKSSLQDVCTLEFSARFGRHLWWTRLANPITKDVLLDGLIQFAAQKLTLGGAGSSLSEEAKMAALSARLAVRLNTSLDSVRSLQDKLVSSHMSVAYHVPDHKNYMYSGHPSEPILMEGAAYVWNNPLYCDFVPLETLQHAVTNGFLAKGERGELVGRYICLRAIDICVVKGGDDLIGDKRMFARAVPLVSYFQAIFGPQWEKIRKSKARNRSHGKMFETACKGKYVRFTHFARAGDASALSTAAGWKALARGNAWQFFDRQEGVDLGIPVFDGDPEDVLDREHVTWILIQIKNSSWLRPVHFSAESLGIFNDRLNKRQTPYFVLVFQFSVKAKPPQSTTRGGSKPSKSTTNRVLPPSPQKVAPRHNKESYETTGEACRVDKRDPTSKTYPCYWVDVIGCSSNVFNSEIIPVGTGVFKQLLGSRGLLDEARSEEKKAAILRLKPFFEAGSASYHWAGDELNKRTPGTTVSAEQQLESVDAGEPLSVEYSSDDDDKPDTEPDM